MKVSMILASEPCDGFWERDLPQCQEPLFGFPDAEWLGMPWWLTLILGLFLLILVFKTFFVVGQKTAFIIERLGKLHAVKHAGLRVKIPFIDRKVAKVSLRVEQLVVEVDTKTNDNVFVDLEVAVQHRVDTSSNARIASSYYELDDPEEQMDSWVVSLMRALVPGKKLDEVFEDVDTISASVMAQLSEIMGAYGYIIVAVQIAQIKPDKKVVKAMNAINAAARDLEAAKLRGEADKVLALKRGEGVGAERTAIARALATAVQELNVATGDTSGAKATEILLAAMHYDAVREASHGSGTILLPTAAPDLLATLTAAGIAANKSSS